MCNRPAVECCPNTVCVRACVRVCVYATHPGVLALAGKCWQSNGHSRPCKPARSSRWERGQSQRQCSGPSLSGKAMLPRTPCSVNPGRETANQKRRFRACGTDGVRLCAEDVLHTPSIAFRSCMKVEVVLCEFWVSTTVSTTLRASLSGTFLQTLPDLVTPLKGHSLSPRSCPATRSAPSERFGY